MKITARDLPVIKTLFPGLLVCATIAAAASFLGEHYSGPSMLFALLLGLAFHFLMDDPRVQPGVNFVASAILRIGVALLGLRITFHDIEALGWHGGLVIVLGVLTTLLFGVALARLLRLNGHFGILTGGAVAICGASAALAISAILPKTETHERDTSFAVIGVTTLSTLSMIIYPIIASLLGYDDQHAGLFIGATIHDVAQVVGAGYSISPDAGDAATITKLLRVALLLPAVLGISLAMRSKLAAGARGDQPPLLPWFLTVFALLVAVNSLISIPAPVTNLLSGASRFFLMAAVAAIGVRTSLKSMTELGARPVLLMLLETAYLAVLAAGLIALA